MANDGRLSESYRKQFKQLEEKNHRLSRQNDILQKELYTEKQRTIQAEERANVASAPAAVAKEISKPPTDEINVLRTRIIELEADVSRQRQIDLSFDNAMTTMRETCKRMREESDELAAENKKVHADADNLRLELSQARDEAERWRAEVQRLEMLMEFKEQRVLQFTASQKAQALAATQKSQCGKKNRALQPTTSSTDFPPISPSRSTAALRIELAHLQQRYDELLDVKERAAARYKADYRKWYNFKNWLLRETEEGTAQQKGMTPEERRWHERQHVVTKQRKYREIMGDVTKGGSTITEPDGIDEGKESKVADETSGFVRALPSSSAGQPPATLPRRAVSSGIRSETHSQSPPLAASSPSLHGKRSRELPIGALPTSPPSKRIRADSVSSSDTEDESQVPSTTAFTRHMIGRVAAISTPTTISRPRSPQRRPPPEFEALFTLTPHRTPSKRQLREDADARLKIPAPVLTPIAPPTSVSSPIPDAPLTSEASSATKAPLQVPDPRDMTPAAPESPIKIEEESQVMFVQGSSKGTKLDSRGELVLTPRRAARRSGDYSAFKGRGRYAAERSERDVDTTINAQFRIDPERNGGRDYQFNEVVRGRQDRRQLAAGDCECCRDYYEAIGPLPVQLQRPAWRSPTASPTIDSRIQRECFHARGSIDKLDFSQISFSRDHGSDEGREESGRKKAIEEHKAEISRHRHQWEPPATPPGYWNIGFPDTQEAEDINEQARVIQQQKMDTVRAEAARSDGKYRRR